MKPHFPVVLSLLAILFTADAQTPTIPELHQEEKELDEQIQAALVLSPAPEQPKMGGVNKKCQLIDQLGRLWMFKIHRDTYLDTVEQVALEVGHLLGMNLPQIYPATLTINGTKAAGNLHQWLAPARDLEKVPPSTLNESQINGILRYQIYDYLIANYDVMPENFLMLEETGEIISIDKDYAFDRYGEALPLMLKPAPGDTYEEDYYRSVWEEYLKKKKEVDFKPLLESVAYVDACDGSFLKKIVEPAFQFDVVRRHMDGMEGFLERKRGIKDRFLTFYTDALKERGESTDGLELPSAEIHAEKVRGLYLSRIESKKQELARLLEAKKGEQQPLNVPLQQRPDSGVEVLTPEQLRRLIYIPKNNPDTQKK